MEIQLACKEWASVCAALASGRQTILLRKGVIAEPTGDFQIQSKWFWLYPTFVHQQQNQLKETEFLKLGENYKAPESKVRLFNLAEIVDSFYITDLAKIKSLDSFHILSDECINSRFLYRTSGLNVLILRIYQATKIIEISETDFYLGCKSWVKLDNSIEAGGVTPVLSPLIFEEEVNKLRNILKD